MPGSPNWTIQMRFTVTAEETELPAIRHYLEECVASYDDQPSFLTAQSWLVEKIELLRHAPMENGRGRGGEWMPSAHHHRRMGYGPT